MSDQLAKKEYRSHLDLSLAIVVIIAGVVLGVIVAWLADRTISVFSELLLPETKEGKRILEKLLRAVLAALAAFWTWSFIYDVVDSREPGSRVALKNNPAALFSWCAAAAFSLLMTANIAGESASEYFEKINAREISILNFNHLGIVDPSLQYSKVAWHFFFEDGILLRNGAPCEASGDEPADIQCPIKYVATHENAPEGVDECKRPVGTAFRGFKDDNEVNNRLAGILRTVAHCVKLDDRETVPTDSLRLVVQSSGRDWKGCSNDPLLNEHLRQSRITRMKALVEGAKKFAKSDDQAINALIDTIKVNEADAADTLDFSDSRYEEAGVGSAGTGNPYDVTQSAALILQKPAGCKLFND